MRQTESVADETFYERFNSICILFSPRLRGSACDRFNLDLYLPRVGSVTDQMTDLSVDDDVELVGGFRFDGAVVDEAAEGR